MDSVIGKIRNLDVYPKINEDFYRRTISGGVITMASSIIMLLFLSELSSYFWICIYLLKEAGETAVCRVSSLLTSMVECRLPPPQHAFLSWKLTLQIKRGMSIPSVADSGMRGSCSRIQPLTCAGPQNLLEIAGILFQYLKTILVILSP